MSLTSHNSGTPVDDEMRDQAEQEDVLNRGEMDRAEHQPGKPEERGQDEQQLSLGNEDQAGHNHASQDNGRAEHCCNQAAHSYNLCTEHTPAGKCRPEQQPRGEYGQEDDVSVSVKSNQAMPSHVDEIGRAEQCCNQAELQNALQSTGRAEQKARAEHHLGAADNGRWRADGVKADTAQELWKSETSSAKGMG